MTFTSNTRNQLCKQLKNSHRPEDYEKFEMKEAIVSAMRDFSDTEKALVQYRFVQDLSQSETAKKLGVSQMFVSRMERKLLLKLKERLKDSV